MVTVPKILPEVPFLEKNPVFLYTYDEFTRPEPFKADVCVNIDDVIEKKIDMYHQHTSQMYEWASFQQGSTRSGTCHRKREEDMARENMGFQVKCRAFQGYSY